MGLVVSWRFRITHISDRVMVVSRKLRIYDLSYLRLFASRTFRLGRSRIAYFSSGSFRSGKKLSGSDRDPGGAKPAMHDAREHFHRMFFATFCTFSSLRSHWMSETMGVRQGQGKKNNSLIRK